MCVSVTKKLNYYEIFCCLKQHKQSYEEGKKIVDAIQSVCVLMVISKTKLFETWFWWISYEKIGKNRRTIAIGGWGRGRSRKQKHFFCDTHRAESMKNEANVRPLRFNVLNHMCWLKWLFLPFSITPPLSLSLWPPSLCICVSEFAYVCLSRCGVCAFKFSFIVRCFYLPSTSTPRNDFLHFFVFFWHLSIAGN